MAAKIQIKSEKITPFGGIYYASKAFYALSLDKVINGTLGVRSTVHLIFSVTGTPTAAS